MRTVTYIYCVGSREHTKEVDAHSYCSRYCCSAAAHASLLVDDLGAGVRQFHLFRDMRTYGKYEILYDQALKQGAVFIRFDDETPPRVASDQGKLAVTVNDRLTGNQEIRIPSDLVVLVTGMTPTENHKLIEVLKLPVGRDGFFNEIHPKLRPVETVIDGVFIAGASQGPKTLAESVSSSMAAVAKTSALLLKGYVDLEPMVAKVNNDLCTWCGACRKACPYDAVEQVIREGKSVARVSPILCKGEGACVPECPYRAIEVEGYTNRQIESMIDALAEETVTV